MSFGHFLKTWIWKSLVLWYKNRCCCWDPAVAAVPVGRDCCWAAHCLSFCSWKIWQEDCLEDFYLTGTSVDLLRLFPCNLMTLLNSRILRSSIWSWFFLPVTALTEILWLWLILEAHTVCEHRVCLKGNRYFYFSLYVRALSLYFILKYRFLCFAFSPISKLSEARKLLSIDSLHLFKHQVALTEFFFSPHLEDALACTRYSNFLESVICEVRVYKERDTEIFYTFGVKIESVSF